VPIPNAPSCLRKIRTGFVVSIYALPPYAFLIIGQMYQSREQPLALINTVLFDTKSKRSGIGAFEEIPIYGGCCCVSPSY
jgi:hypothetical protein